MLKIARMALDVVDAQGVGEDGPEVLDALGRGLEPLRVVEASVESGRAWMRPPAVAELVGVDAVEDEPAVAVLEGGHAVVVAVEEQFDGLAAELRGVEAVEEDRPPAALGVADLADEDGGVGALVAALAGEEGVADPLDEEPLDRLGRPGVLDVAGGVLAGA